VPSFVDLIDTTQVNLRRTITDIFRRGARNASLSDLKIVPKVDSAVFRDGRGEALSRADSLLLKREGVLADTTAALAADSAVDRSDGTAADTLRIELGPDEAALSAAADPVPRTRKAVRRQNREARKKSRMNRIEK
jgi:hypothetical protein